MALTNILESKLLSNAPRILALLDKNPFSKTYGSFDRKYWQYKIIDFPCGMQQELALPLAYLWKTQFHNNSFYNSDRIAEYIDAIFNFHSISSNSDGSLDDYFPHERAYGATAYTLSSLTEAALLTMKATKAQLLSFEKSGEFLAGYRESGKLSNHLAIASLALINLFKLTGNTLWKSRSDILVDELAQQQSAEGWFKEYKGCDIGYQTVSFEFLARRYVKSPSPSILGMLERCLSFIYAFAHPDGSLGGEYGSRGTYNFYPGGFAVMSSELPRTRIMLGYFFKGLNNGSCNYLEDDGVFGHLLSSYVVALQCGSINPEKPQLPEYQSTPLFEVFDQADLAIGKTCNLRLFLSMNRGGAYKIFKDDKLLLSDTGLVGALENGSVFCQNKPMSSNGSVSTHSIVVTGEMLEQSDMRLSRWHMIFLRGASIVFGWLPVYSNMIRWLMQNKLIFGKKKIPIKFKRVFHLKNDMIIVEDHANNNTGSNIIALRRSTDYSDIHVVTSNSFQEANLLQWERLTVNNDNPQLSFKKVFMGDTNND